MSTRLVLASVVAIVGFGVVAETPLATQKTQPRKVTPTEYGVGAIPSFSTSGKIGKWQAVMKVTGASDVHILSNRIAPGGSFGWHSHPGPSFVTIKKGTATVYFGADPTCRAHRYRAGKGFVDKGLQVHLVRNEGKVDLVTVVVSFTPRGAMRRIDEPNPANANCPIEP
jgi:quercetin dioxygenase-like cupin family protein